MIYKKIVFAVLFSIIICSSGTVLAITEQERQTLIAQLQAQIAQLYQQIAQMQWCHTFNIDLDTGSAGSETAALQIALQREGFTISASEIQNQQFGATTGQAVKDFKVKYSSQITTSGTTKVGAITRGMLNQLYGCSNDTYIPACTNSNWTYTLSPSTCPSSETQTKYWSSIGTCAGGVSHPATESVACNYQVSTCASFTYSNWSACTQSGIQTRTVISSFPSGCTGGNPTTSTTCSYIPPCVPNWSCGAWSTCVNGQQTQTCADLNNCGILTGKPATTQSCVPPAPTVDIKANNSDGPITIFYNASALLTWTSLNATSCTASSGWSGSKNISGNETTSKLSSSKTYTLTCTGAGGTASDSVVINISSESSVDIKANNSDGPITVPNNSNALLSWTSFGVNSCSLAKYSCTPLNCYSNMYGSGDPVSDWGSQLTETLLNRNGSQRSYIISCIKNSDSNSACYPNWVCGSWSQCYADGYQRKTCVDLNNCNTLAGKPAVIKPCSSSCSGDWQCTNWSFCNNGQETRSCTNSCGLITNKPSETRACISDKVSINVDALPLAPTVSIKANGLAGTLSMPSSRTILLSWESSDATDCMVFYSDYSFGVNKPLIGSEYVTIPQNVQFVTYSIACTGPGGTATNSVQVGG